MGVVGELGWDPVAVPPLSGGVFADVKLVPSGETLTCFVGMPAAGSGSGAWFPPEVGETVLVAVPGGDPGHGPVIVSRFWSMDRLPPDPTDLDWADGATSLEPPTDIVVRARPGQSIKIRGSGANLDLRVEGTGDVVVENLGTGTVKLGLAETAEPLAKAKATAAALGAFVELLATLPVPLPALGSALVVPPPGGPGWPASSADAAVLASPVYAQLATLKTEAT
jgi:hypothetical protein